MRIRECFWVLFLLAVSAGCSPSAQRDVESAMPLSAPLPNGARYGGHLKIGIADAPTSLDAVLGRSGIDAYFWRPIYDQLVDAAPDLDPRRSTSLAVSWEIATDPDSITFRLRDGVVFHDGTPFDAYSVKFNIDRILDPNTKATPRASMTVIDSVEVIDSLTVRFNLKRSWGAGLAMLADRGGVMNSPAQILALGADYGWSPSGTGPFRIAELITGTMVRFERNENYWGTDSDGNRLPYLDAITIRVIRDQTVLASAIKTGEIDIAYLPYKDVASFRLDNRFRIQTMEGGSIALLLAFNVDKPPLDDVNLRLAIAHAIDPEIINRAIFFEKAIEADSGMWPVGAWAHDPGVDRPTFNLSKAQQYMTKSGSPEGFSFTAVTNTSPVLVPTAEIIRQMLKRINVDMKIEVLSAGSSTERFFHGQEYPLYLTAWSRYPEPDWLASLAYKSDGYYNAGNVDRPDLDRLVELGSAAYDREQRKRFYTELNSKVLSEAWFVPLLYGVTYAAAPSHVGNLEVLMGWDGKMNLREIYLNE